MWRTKPREVLAVKDQSRSLLDQIEHSLKNSLKPPAAMAPYVAPQPIVAGVQQPGAAPQSSGLGRFERRAAPVGPSAEDRLSLAVQMGKARQLLTRTVTDKLADQQLQAFQRYFGRGFCRRQSSGRNSSVPHCFLSLHGLEGPTGPS
jgi:hypothetical protein